MEYGCNSDGDIHWMDNAFLLEVESIMVKTEYSDIIEKGEDILEEEESDEDDRE